MNDAGHRSRKGKLFTDSDVYRALVDSTAKGLYRGNFCRRTPEGKWELKPESEWVFTAVEPLVSEDLWERCNKMVADRKVRPRRVTKKPVHLFAGVTWCICGSKMYVRTDTPKYVCEACRNKIPMEDLEGVFHEQLKSFFLSPEEVVKYLNEADQGLTHKQEVLDVLVKERQRVAGEMEKVYQLYLAGQISAQGFGSRNQPLENRVKQLDEEIPRLQAEVDFMKISYLSKDEVLTNARDLYTRWPQLAHEDKLQITTALIQKITVGKGEIDITLCYLPSPASPPHQMMTNGQQIPRALIRGAALGLDFEELEVVGGGVEEGDGFGVGAVESAGVDDAGGVAGVAVDALIAGEVGVAVDDVVVNAGAGEFFEAGCVVAVEEGDAGGVWRGG